MSRFVITISRSRGEEASVTRYQLQTDLSESRPEAGESGSSELSPLCGDGPSDRKEPK